MNLDSIIAYSIISEFLFCLFTGFLLGWMIVLGTDTTTALKIKIAVGVLFSAILFWLAYSAPRFLVVFYGIKVWFLVGLAIAITYFFFDDPHLNKKKLKVNLKNVTLVFLSASIFLIFSLILISLVSTAISVMI